MRAYERGPPRRRCGRARSDSGDRQLGRGLSPQQLQRYFSPLGREWQISAGIRAVADFRVCNLMKDIGALGRFDIIFCRNVAIYFSAEDKISLFNRLERALEPAGYLLIGAMESLAGACNQFEAHRHLRSIFYQVNRRP